MNFISLDIQADVASITIQREKALNALNSEVLKELNHAIDTIESQVSKIRVLTIRGAGEKSFVAGADISEMVKLTPLEAREFLTYGQRVLDRIEGLPVPVVAVINGYALGGGLELALACDIRLATENAILGLPEVSLGLIPSFGGTQRLTRAVGSSVAKSMILMGKKIDANRAYELGLVDDVTSFENLGEKLGKIIKTLKKMAPVALHAAKDAIYAASNTDIIGGQELEVNYASMCFSTDDIREGMGAFLEKRRAEFTGK